jgi:hypothetical protein
VHRADAVLGALAEHVQRDARQPGRPRAQQVQHQGVLDQPDRRVRLDALTSARCTSAPVASPPACTMRLRW